MKNNILIVLQRNNMTQKDLSVKTGLTEVSISRYVQGKRIPKINDCLKISKVLNCTVEELFEL